VNRIPPGWIFLAVVAVVLCILGGVVVSDLAGIINAPQDPRTHFSVFQRLVQAMFG
jgi:hypothetical protein